jgi:hypothetical protein
MCDPWQAALRRLAKNRGLLGLVGLASFFVANASAAPTPALFKLSIRGTANQQWSYTTAPRQTGSCSRTDMSEGIRSVQFRTKAASLVRLVGGRILPADVRSLTGTVTLVGANTIDEQCGDVGTSRIADCVRTTRSFSGGRLRVSSPRPGLLALGTVRGIRMRDSDCPIEPTAVMRRPLGPELSTLRLPEEVLGQARVTRITMRGSRSRTIAYAAPEDGSLKERGEWRLTFVRVKP